MAALNVKPPDDIKRKGVLTKLKTKKKKFFVLRDEVDKNNPARLEYFQDEAKFLAAPGKPRRSILLRDCLNITDGSTNGRGPSLSSGGSEVIHIYTKKDAFRIGCSSEAEKNEWLSNLLQLKNKSQEDKTLTDQDNFEFSWDVRVMKKSNGSCRKIKPGKYRFCLSHKSINLIGEGNCSQGFEFALESIRKLGDTKDLFFLELGTSSSIGEGQLWIEVDDPIIASNIHMHVFSRMNDCGPGGRPRSQTMVGPGRKTVAVGSKGSKRSSVLSTSSTSTSSTATVVADACSDSVFPNMPGGRTTSSSSVSSLRSSGSSLPSSVNKSSLSSILFPAKIGLPSTSAKEEAMGLHAPYFFMDGFKQTDLDLADLLRTSSVGNKAEYLKNVQHHQHHFSQASKDSERCSSAPHLKNEGEGQETNEELQGVAMHSEAVDLALQDPPPYKEGCFYCEALNSSSSRKVFYAPLDFEKPGKSKHLAAGICKRASCHIKNKVMTPKQPVGGKIFRSNPLTNYQHLLHHVVLDSSDHDHSQKRERLPTIDGSMMPSRPVPCCQPRPRALTGDQKNLAVRNRCCREALENGYMKMHGFVADSELRQLGSDDKKVFEDEPYLDMTEGFKRIQLNPQHFTDYLDMSLGKAARIPTSTRASNADVDAAAAGDGGVLTGAICLLSAPAKSVDGSNERYMEMSFDRTSAPAVPCDCSFGVLSSASSCSSSSVSSVTSRNNFSTTTISNLASPMTSPGEYMTMSFSPCDRFS